MKPMGKMQYFYAVMWCSFFVMDTQGYGVTDNKLSSKDAQRNTILRLYDIKPTNKTENTTQYTSDTNADMQPKHVDVCEDAISTAIKHCDSTAKQSFLAIATFEKLSEVLFDFGILQKLQEFCTNETWCLDPEEETRVASELSNTFLPYCSVGPCLLQMDDTCLTKERRFTLASLLLLCRADELSMSPNCLMSLRKMTHVTMAMLRKELSQRGSNVTTTYQTTCSTTHKLNCTGSCLQVAKQLHCTCESCDHQMHFLQEFGPWQWFYNDEKMEVCGISNVTDCSSFNSPLAVNFQLEDTASLWQYLQEWDIGVLIGAGIAGGATLILLSCLIAFCVNNIRSSDNRHYITYHEITSSETDDLTKDAFNDVNVVDLNKVYESID